MRTEFLINPRNKKYSQKLNKFLVKKITELLLSKQLIFEDFSMKFYGALISFLETPKAVNFTANTLREDLISIAVTLYLMFKK